MAHTPVTKRTRTRRTTAGSRRLRPPPTEAALVRIEDDAVAPRGQRLIRVIRLTGGWMIFGVGVVFVIVPVIPGTPLVILAAFLLAPDVPFFARVLDWGKSRFSHITTGIHDVNERFTEDFHRRFS